MARYTDRDIFNALDGRPTEAQDRANRRIVDALNGTVPSPQPFDMAEHARLFDEARITTALGGEMPEPLRAHAEVIEAENAYAAALRQAQPAAFKNDDDLKWVTRNKRADLIREHQFASEYTDEVLARVAEGFRTAAQALTRPAPPRPPAKARTTAAEATTGRRIVRVTEQVRPTIR